MTLIEHYKAWRERRHWQRWHLHFVRTLVNEDWRWLGANAIADELTTRYRAALSDNWYARQHEPVSDFRDRLSLLYGKELFKIPGAAALAARSACRPARQSEETPAKYDDVLIPFLSLMRKELHANCGKGDRPGWLAMDANTALLEVYHHLAKLQKAVRNNDGPRITEYSADVANMAMMVLDICGGLAFVEADAGAGRPGEMALTVDNVHALSAMAFGAPAPIEWVRDVGLPFIQAYEQCLARGERPRDPARAEELRHAW
jgi:hypothetical protein